MQTAIGVMCLVASLAMPRGWQPQVGETSAKVQYIGHDRVQELISTGGPILKDTGLLVAVVRRGAGEAEYHEHTTHVFFMIDGEATLVVGGKLVDPKSTAPDQIRASAIEGGTEYHLSKGDVITIPAKTPHWFKEVSTKTASYYAVNIESQ